MQEQDKDEIIPVDEEAMQRVYEANRKANEKWQRKQRYLRYWSYGNLILAIIALIVQFRQ